MKKSAEKNGLSRRQFLGTGAAGSAVLLGGIGPADAAAARASRIRADVCVVGAGFAGLAAALRLRQAGANVVLLEARNRVGGRSWTMETKDGGWIDLGGQWVGPDQKRFLALIQEMGCETYPTPNFGKSLILGVTEQRYGGDDDFPGHDEFEAVLKKIDDMAQTIKVDAPWEYPDAERLDATTFAAWLRDEVPNENTRKFVGRLVSSIMSSSPTEFSILHILHIIKSCTSMSDIMGTETGAQAFRLIHGTQFVAKRVAEKLGRAIRFDAPVRKIEWNDRGVTVHSDAFAVAARHVIVAVPPTLAGAIEYAPSLPTARTQVTQRAPQGLVIKVQMIFDRPFWRDAGLNGASLDYTEVVSETADSGVPEKYSKIGILTGFVYSDEARKVAPLPAEERKKLILASVAKRFGEKAQNPTNYVEMNWTTQQWTRGCFSGFLTPGATVLFRSATRDSVGRIHWAGTETSTVWPSFIDGAIFSGERAARAVIAAKI